MGGTARWSPMVETRTWIKAWLPQAQVRTWPASGRKTLQEPADKTDGYSPPGITRSEGTDADEGTIACAMDDDMGHVVPPGVVQPGEVDITAEEREAGNRRSSTPALSVSSKTQ